MTADPDYTAKERWPCRGRHEVVPLLKPSRCARTLAVVTAGLLLGAPAQIATGAAQQTIIGAWRSETPSWWTDGWTVVFDVSGDSVTGAVTNCPRAGAVEIFDARIEAGTVNFKCRSEDGKSTIAFTGKVDGDRITFSWDLHEPEPVPAPAYDTGERPGDIIARRVSAGAGRLILDRVAERRRITRPPFTLLTFDRILNADREPQNWLTYSGSLQGGRHSSLKTLTPDNVAQLDLAWLWTSQSTGQFEATPLVVDGVLYTVQAPNDVVALDAISGEVLWTFKYTPAAGARATGGGGRPNRGLAMLGDRLFLGTLDAHLLAIDARTGKLVWDITVADSADAAADHQM